MGVLGETEAEEVRSNMRRIFLLSLFSSLLSNCSCNWDNVFVNDVTGDNVSAILNQMAIGYDKRVRPNYGGIPVTVGVSLYILSMSELSEANMDFTFDMYFRQFWHDPRLAFEQRPTLNKLVLGSEFMKNIWVPDTFFVNEKKSHYHQATTDNQFLRIMYTGNILKSVRLTVKASCPLDLQYFPMDSQMCSLEIESFGYTMSDIKYRWEDGENSVQMSPDVSLPEFKVLGHRQRFIEASLSSGNYSRLIGDVVFVRSVGPYVIQVYLPMALMVMMSWLALWLREVTARVGLCMITILSVIIIIISIHSSLPRISYYTAIDVYFYLCFLSIFAILIESVCVSFITTWIKDREMESRDRKGRGMRVLCGFDPIYLDWISRIGFPIIFLIFNIVYRNTYSVTAKDNIANLIDLVLLE